MRSDRPAGGAPTPDAGGMKSVRQKTTPHGIRAALFYWVKD